MTCARQVGCFESWDGVGPASQGGQPLKCIKRNLPRLVAYCYSNMDFLRADPDRARQIRCLPLHNGAARRGCTTELQTLVGLMIVILRGLLVVTKRGGYMDLEVLDGVILTPGVSLLVVPTRTITTHDVVPLQRNGPAECDISLMLNLGQRDCVVVALNNLAGHDQFSRRGMAALEARFRSGDMPCELICRAMQSGKSPYAGRVLQDLVGSYDVFTREAGMFFICAQLVMRAGARSVQHHAIAFDANRGIVNFGVNMTSVSVWQVTLLTEKPDRVDSGAAKANMLKHFPDLKEIKVVHVIQMMVKTRKLKFTPEFTRSAYAVEIAGAPPAKKPRFD